MATKITSSLLLDFLHCKRKAFLKAIGGPADTTDFDRIRLDLDRAYELQAREKFLKSHDDSQVTCSPSCLACA